MFRNIKSLNKVNKNRFNIISKVELSIFILLYLIIIIRFFYLQIINGESLRLMSRRETSKIINEISSRRDIVDRNGIILAESIPAYSVYGRTDDFAYIREAESILNIGSEKIALTKKHFKKNHFLWIARRKQLSVDMVKKLYEIDGINLIRTTRRIYPEGKLASHLLGFCGVDGNGLEGIEKSFNKEIKIKNNMNNIITTDALHREIAYKQPAVRRYDKIHLTIDSRLQAIVQRELSAGVKKFQAESGVAIMMSKDGGILALSSYPEYNLNKPYNVPYKIMRDKAVSNIFEPGSVFKIVTISAALNTNSVRPNELFFTHNGKYKVGKYIIHDAQPHGWLTAKQIVVQSSNIGAMEIARKVGETKFFSYIKKFGFGQKTMIRLPGEAKGIVGRNYLTGKDQFTTVAFGQGIAVTALQMTKAFAIIANGGKNVYPHLLLNRALKNPIRIIKEKTAHQVINILEAAVKNGTGQKAYMKSMEIAGKTGTAQIPSHGGYLKNQFISSFGGIFPANKPEAVLYIALKKPKIAFYGGLVAAPIFRNIIRSSFLILKQLK